MSGLQHAQAAASLACEGAVQGEAIKVPELDGLIRGGRRQLAHVWAQQALQDVGPCASVLSCLSL